MNPDEGKPFEGIRVLDLTHVLAGPFSTFQLACLGADVIKIESPHTPDMTRIEGVDAEQNAKQYGSYFYSQNAGKRGITLDLKTDTGRDVLWRLIQDADVLVQNYAGNSLDKLGFSYEAVAKANPDIIYCKISGFGATGPKADHPAYDVVIQAFSGLMAANGEANANPVRVGPPMVDYGSGAQAAFAISAALFQRLQTGRGQYIDVSMLDAALMMMSAQVVDTSITNESPSPHGNAHPSLAGYATYDTADGQLMIGAWTNKQISSLFKALGKPERAKEILNTEREHIGLQRDADSKLISEILMEKSADEWEALLNHAHIPAARVRTLDETLIEEQLRHRGVLQGVSGDDQQPDSPCPAVLPVTAFTYAHGSPGIKSAPPKLGEHTREVLLEAGYSESELKQILVDNSA